MFPETFFLNSGTRIPMVGFGTYQIHGQELIHTVLDFALQIGYRHFDTAVVYRNEQYIGAALQVLLPKYNLKREDIFITSKLIAQANQSDDHVPNLVKTSLKNLQTNYIDLYLIHWPGVSGIPIDHLENKTYRKNTWSALVNLQKVGLLRAVGVSNYTVRHISELLQHPSGVKPAVNQVEWHPHYHEDELLKLCESENIFLQAYSSLGTSNFSSLRDDPQIVAIAGNLGKSPAQVLLAWALQQGIGVIPKARSYEHIMENFQLDFTIPEEEMRMISRIKVEEKYAWDPNSVA